MSQSQHHLHKDTTLTKLFVGGLPYHTKDDTLKKFFDQFGEIEEAVVIYDREKGTSKGYGFVTMSTPEEARKACQEPNPIIDGRKANVNLAILGAKQRTIPGTVPMAFKPGVLPAALAGLPAMQLAAMQNQYAAGCIPLGSTLLYPSPYQPTAQQSLMAVSPQSPLSTCATTAQYAIDYAQPYAEQYQSYHPAYAALASGLIQPSYAFPPAPALAETALTGYAPQQIQERL